MLRKREGLSRWHRGRRRGQRCVRACGSMGSLEWIPYLLELEPEELEDLGWLRVAESALNSWGDPEEDDDLIPDLCNGEPVVRAGWTDDGPRIAIGPSLVEAGCWQRKVCVVGGRLLRLGSGGVPASNDKIGLT